MGGDPITPYDSFRDPNLQVTFFLVGIFIGKNSRIQRAPFRGVTQQHMELAGMSMVLRINGL